MSTIAKSSTQSMQWLQSTLEEDGYVAQIGFDGRAEVFFGKVIGTRDVITFRGKSVDELKQAFRDSIKAYRDLSEKRGKEPEKSFSGKIPFRTTPEVHQSIYKAAQLEKKSVNAWMNKVLAEVAQRTLESPRASSAPLDATSPDRQDVLDSVREYLYTAKESLSDPEKKEKTPFGELPVEFPFTIPAVAGGVPIALPLNVLIEGVVVETCRLTAPQGGPSPDQSDPLGSAFYASHNIPWGADRINAARMLGRNSPLVSPQAPSQQGQE